MRVLKKQFVEAGSTSIALSASTCCQRGAFNLGWLGLTSVVVIGDWLPARLLDERFGEFDRGMRVHFYHK